MSAMTDMAVPDAVLRLAAGRQGEAGFLSAHHVEAARRLALLFGRARLSQRVTMSYDPARAGGRGSGTPVQGALSDSAADARRRLSELAKKLPHDCWSVLFDVCGLERGLQDVETEKGWPRRGAKLVLRIALDQVAQSFGLDAEAAGRESGANRHWLPERPAMFADE